MPERGREHDMEKVRKFFEWLWNAKERLVLAVMVMLLCWNVYRVVYPPKPAEPKVHRAPDRSGFDEIPQVTPLEPAQSQDWASIYTPNPFWYLAGQKINNDTEKPEDVGITLLDIRQVRGKNRAKLQTESSARWYDEGQQFESFELLSVDPDAGTCQVRSEGSGKVITLRKSGE